MSGVAFVPRRGREAQLQHRLLLPLGHLPKLQLVAEPKPEVVRGQAEHERRVALVGGEVAPVGCLRLAVPLVPRDRGPA